MKVVNVGTYICAQPEHVDKTVWNINQEGIQSGVLDRGRNGRSMIHNHKGYRSPACIWALLPLVLADQNDAALIAR
jgi:hypothetical protein